MTQTNTIPPQFDEQFLDWFRERTEAYWATLPQQTPEEVLAQFVKAEVGGSTWQPGTRWLGGLSEDEISAIEKQWSLSFPPDYRLFLRHLHSVDKPRLCAYYIPNGEDEMRDISAFAYSESTLATAFVPPHKQYMALSEALSFYNWQTDIAAINGRFARLWEGLEFDVEHNDLWLDSWGDRPASLGEQQQRVHDLVLAAPKLIPIIGHRYLLAEPYAPNNPVFSVYQSDIIIYGANLYSYFIAEFGNLLRLNENEYQAARNATQEQTTNAAYHTAEEIPFWGEILTM